MSTVPNATAAPSPHEERPSGGVGACGDPVCRVCRVWQHGWKHQAVYHEDAEAIITHVAAVGRQVVTDTMTGQVVGQFEDGATIFVERSRKLSTAAIATLGRKAGLRVGREWSPADKFHLLLELLPDRDAASA